MRRLAKANGCRRWNSRIGGVILGAVFLWMATAASVLLAADTQVVEEKWPDGSVKVRREVTSDVRGGPVQNGLETRYFHGGAKQSETTFRQGVLEGPWHEYYQSGAVKAEGTYRAGQKDGVETTYSERGQKSGEVTYRTGVRSGSLTRWQGSHKVYEAQFEDGHPVGTLQEWFGDGNPKIVQHYKANLLDGLEQRWYAGGRRFSEANYVAGAKDGPYQEWHSNGRLRIRSAYKSGQLNGKFEEWFADGAPKSVGSYADGLPDGLWKQWYDLEPRRAKPKAGEKKTETVSADRQSAADGAKKPDDSTSSTDAADDSAPAGSTEADKFKGVVEPKASASDEKQPKEADTVPQHVLASEYNYRRGQLNGKQTTYHKSGPKQMEISTVEGKREGPYIEWYENGQVRSKGTYFRDAPNGEVSYWFDDGRPWAVYYYNRGRPSGRWLQWDQEGNVVADENHD